jgi:hypothetical protein
VIAPAVERPEQERLQLFMVEVGRIAEEAGRQLARMVEALQGIKLSAPIWPAPPRPARLDAERWAHALEARRARGTGPARPSGQNAHRPRLHR